MRIENCVPMIALCLLLCGCGKQTAEPAADLRSVYQEMSGCEMTAEVTCEQSELEWSATLHGTYVPGGESTVEVLEPLELAGVRAVIREEGWTLEYGDLCLDAGTLTEEAVSPATALARIMYALREGWLLEQNNESREGVPLYPAGAGPDRRVGHGHRDHRLASSGGRNAFPRRDRRGRRNNFDGTVYEIRIL